METSTSPNKNYPIHFKKRTVFTTVFGLFIFIFLLMLGTGIGYYYSQRFLPQNIKISDNVKSDTTGPVFAIVLPTNLPELPATTTVTKENNISSSPNIFTALSDEMKEITIINSKGLELYNLNFGQNPGFFEWNPSHRYLFIQTDNYNCYLFDALKGKLNLLQQGSGINDTTYFWRNDSNLIKIVYQYPPNYVQGDFPSFIRPTIYNYSIPSNKDTLIGKFPDEPYLPHDYLGSPLPERSDAEKNILGFVLNDNLIVANLSRNFLKNDYYTYNIKTGDIKEITSGSLGQPILINPSNDGNKYVYMDDNYSGIGSKIVMYNEDTNKTSTIITKSKAFFPMFGKDDKTIIFMSPTGDTGLTTVPGDNITPYQKYNLMQIDLDGSLEHIFNNIIANGFSGLHFYQNSSKAYFTTQTIGDNYLDILGFYEINSDGSSLTKYYTNQNLNMDSALIN